jgi:nucleolar GTP-binding protein
MKRQKDTLAYLEQVRQHMGRLPSIDPNTRTLLICGYPNVGKSSFINKLTRADVDVQPYAFTTKSLFVGHMDYKYLRWQVIDTPGILDHPLEDRNTIEMLSITALAHLRSCVLYFMDLSEQCGYSVDAQVRLFESIKPLFANKPLVLVINKIDVRQIGQLSAEEQQSLQRITGPGSGVEVVELSCYTDQGVMEARNFACDKLLASRVESKLRSGAKVNDVLQKIHVAQPQQRDERPRPAFIPDAIRNRMVDGGQEQLQSEERVLERDIERENGGAGVYIIDLKKKYLLESEEWKKDVIPEIIDGHNVADWIDPDIERRLAELEEEEQRRVESGDYVSDIEDEDGAEVRQLARAIMNRKEMIRSQHAHQSDKNRPMIPLKTKARVRTVTEMVGQLSAATGVDAGQLEESIRRKRARSVQRTGTTEAEAIVRSASQAAPRGVSVVRDRSMLGVRNVKQKLESVSLKKKAERGRNLEARAGEADRHSTASKPKHLFSGKRKQGTANHR